MFLGDIVNTLAPSGWGLDRTKAVLSITAVLAPLCLLPDLSALAPMAYVGIMAVLYSSFVVVKRFLDGSCGGAGAFMSSLPFTPGTGQLSAARLSLGTCVLFNMLNTAFMAHTNAVRFYNELEGRTPEKFGKVVAGAFGLSALLYCLFITGRSPTDSGSSSQMRMETWAMSSRFARPRLL